MKIETGDVVRTKSMMFFVEATNLDTGEEIEVMLPKGYPLKVCAVDDREKFIWVALPDDFIAILSYHDVEL